MQYGVVLTVECALSSATGQPAVLNVNSTFESGITPWIPRFSTISQSAAWSQEDSYSLKVTPDGVSVRGYAESENIPVLPGQSYVAAGYVNMTSSWTGGFSFSVNWFNAGGTYISTSSNDNFSMPSGVSSQSNLFTAPANAYYATLVPTMNGTPPASQVFYVDNTTLSTLPSGYGTWDTAVWNTSTWGPDVLWTDISAYVRSISTDRRFSRDVQVWESGAATVVLDNRDARFSPSNLAGPYVIDGITGVRPWRPIRIRAAWANVTYDVYRGYAIDWQESYVQASPGGGDAIMTVQCQDEFGSLARFGGLAVTPIGAGEMSGQRVHRVLNSAGHTGARAIDVGITTMQATDLSTDTASLLKVVADSEGGGLFVDRAGTVVFERQTALVENGRSRTVQATYGDKLNELPYSGVVPSYDGSLIVNIAAWSRDGGTVQVVTDEPSRALYQDKRQTRSDLMCQTDQQVANVATFYILRYRQPEDRIASVQIKPRGDPARLFPQVLGREVRDLVRAVRRPPGGITITRDCHVAGIAHSITADDWVTAFTLWSATVYRDIGRFDSGTWDTSIFFI